MKPDTLCCGLNFGGGSSRILQIFTLSLRPGAFVFSFWSQQLARACHVSSCCDVYSFDSVSLVYNVVKYEY